MAPEIYNQRELSKAIDTFAFGTMLYEMFSKSVPWDGLEPADIMKKLKQGQQLESNQISPRM